MTSGEGKREREERNKTKKPAVKRRIQRHIENGKQPRTRRGCVFEREKKKGEKKGNE